jgi:hypothetical protein
LSHVWAIFAWKSACSSHISSYLKCFFFRPRLGRSWAHYQHSRIRSWSDAAVVGCWSAANGNHEHQLSSRTWQYSPPATFFSMVQLWPL